MGEAEKIKDYIAAPSCCRTQDLLQHCSTYSAEENLSILVEISFNYSRGIPEIVAG